MARRYMKNEAQGNSLQATVLVHEVYLRLVDVTNVEWQARAQFFAIAAQMMRRILVDAARTRGSRRRDGIPLQVNLDESALLSPAPDRAILALDEALTAFSQVAPRQAKVVELRYFGGLTDEEIVAALKISPRTARRDWHFAKAWLLGELGDTIGETSGLPKCLRSASGKSKSYTTPLARTLPRSGPCCSLRPIPNYAAKWNPCSPVRMKACRFSTFVRRP